MPKKNEILQKLLENAAEELAVIDSSDEEADEMVFNELEENASIFAGLRYSYRGIVPKNLSWYDEILPNLDEKRFRMLL